MRNTEFELTDFNKKTRAIDFQEIPTPIRSNVLRLLNHHHSDQDASSSQQNVYCWLYIDPLSTFTLVWNLIFLLIFYLVELQISLCLAFGPSFFD
jgi:hypothetical protein